MRWQSGRRSENVEDRRGVRVSKKAAGGGIGTIIILLIALFLGIDPSALLKQTGVTEPSTESTQTRSPEEDKLADFVSVVLGDTEDVWHDLFQKMGKQYKEPNLVLFTGAVESACGFAESAMGPFYCPADQKVYIDLSFYQDLKDRHNAPGDFAQAYVIAHEVGHHVQTLLGISKQVYAQRRQSTQAESNKLLVRQELQADCFAGIWAHHADKARQVLEQGDVEEALGAASAVGDDRLQKKARGYITPDSFTHGTSAQRVSWFKKGIESGKVDTCDTFSATTL